GSAIGTTSGAKLGRLVAQRRPLPERAQRGEDDPRVLLRQYRNRLFNRYVAARVDEGLLATPLSGDVLLTGLNRAPRRQVVEVVTDVEAAAKRCVSWEAVALGPLFGRGLTPAADVAAVREAALLEAVELDEAAFTAIAGGRRALRIQPQGASVEIEKDDLSLTLVLPAEAYIDTVLAEFFDREGASDDD
ncbi:MAG: tRNA pseudouridine(13) synthase TruD, partial [Planctomycetota bacterium]